MSGQMIAADPAALASVGAHLTTAARSVLPSGGRGASVGDPAADAALQDFLTGWADHLRMMEEAIRLTGMQARLTASAFRAAGG